VNKLQQVTEIFCFRIPERQLQLQLQEIPQTQSNLPDLLKAANWLLLSKPSLPRKFKASISNIVIPG
jgi:hypothetical protein